MIARMTEMRLLISIFVLSVCCLPSLADLNGGNPCAACTIIVSLGEQLGEINNQTVVKGLQLLCDLLPGGFQKECKGFVSVIEPELQELIDLRLFTPDVACHVLSFCRTDPGQSECRLYNPPGGGISVTDAALKLTQRGRQSWKRYITSKNKVQKVTNLKGNICDQLPFGKDICEFIYGRIDNHLPLVDFDGDKFSTIETIRGTHFRGRDCDDYNAQHHPGTRPIMKDRDVDSNCNGIYGIDNATGTPYEDLFCKGTDPYGVIVLGDSAAAHFHIPPNWVSAPNLSVEGFEDLPEVVADEFDWPHLSSVTGYTNSSRMKWPTDSFYLKLREFNRCIHRDYQNIGVNGARCTSMNNSVQYSMTRNQEEDYPAVVFYSLIGNDVCNGHQDTIAHMTMPAEMNANFRSTLQYLDTQLPKGSKVFASGLADGRILYSTLHNQIHPIGDWRQDVTYRAIYDFLNCLEISPCMGWTSSNESLRNFTSERAANLSKAIQEEVKTFKAKNFDLHYLEFDLRKVVNEWVASGGKAKDLIEPVDGFHPSQLANYLTAQQTWQMIQEKGVKFKKNSRNADIKKIFGDQGGY